MEKILSDESLNILIMNLSLKDYAKVMQDISEKETELQDANESIIWWTNRFNAVERDNRNYKLKIDKIINELEKWLEEKQALYGINQQGFSWGVCGEALDKLKELKEGVNNENK